jgi:hypothetical protein
VTPRPLQSARFDRPQLLFIAATIIWAAVIIDTGDIAWPLAVWVGTALVPLSLSRRQRRDPRSPTR